MKSKRPDKVFNAVPKFAGVSLLKMHEPQLFWIALALKFDLDERALRIIGETYSNFELNGDQLIMPASIYYGKGFRK